MFVPKQLIRTVAAAFTAIITTSAIAGAQASDQIASPLSSQSAVKVTDSSAASVTAISAQRASGPCRRIPWERISRQNGITTWQFWEILPDGSAAVSELSSTGNVSPIGFPSGACRGVFGMGALPQARLAPKDEVERHFA